MKFILRTFSSGDDKQLCELWNRSLPEDRRELSLFRREILLDQNFSPDTVFMAFFGNKLIGVSGGLKRRHAFGPDGLEKERGWLLYFYVDEVYRRQGVGSALLAAFENKMKHNGVERISFSDYTPGYLLPGLDYQRYPEGFSLLSSRDYRIISSPVAMRKALSGYSMSEEVSGLLKLRIKEGYLFKKPEEKDYYLMTDFCRKEFSYDWERIIREAILSGKADRNINLVLSSEGEILGFACFGLVGSRPNRFGPFGVASKFRGLSLGRILLNHCLKDLAENGFKDTFFLWTYEDDPAGFLYARTGFEVIRRFHIMEKMI